MINYIAWRGIVRHSKNRYVLRFYPAICKNNVHLAKTFIRKQNYINNKKLFVLHRDIQIIIQSITNRFAYTNTNIQALWVG